MAAQAAGAGEVVDQYGNKIEVNKAMTIIDKERKNVVKDIKKRLKEHRRSLTARLGCW